MQTNDNVVRKLINLLNNIIIMTNLL